MYHHILSFLCRYQSWFHDLLLLCICDGLWIWSSL